MAFFKTKIERQMEAEMKQTEQMDAFNARITQLENMRQEYVKIAAKAEVNNDTQSYNTAVNNLIELNGMISALTQSKANYDLMNVANAVGNTIALAVNALEAMAGEKKQFLDMRKIQKATAKVRRHMGQVQISQKAMGKMLSMSNPANKPRSSEEINSVRPMIEAEIYKITGESSRGLGSLGGAAHSGANFNLSKMIESEKNRLID